jgi:hypothetical protein
MEPPPSLTTPAAALSPRGTPPHRQLPPKENSRSVGSLPVVGEGAPSSPRGGFFSKSPRTAEKDKSPPPDKDKSPRKAGLRKGSAPMSIGGGPLQRDTKQLELVQAALAKKKGKTPKFSTIGRKAAVPQPVKKGSSSTLNKSGFRPAAVVTELAPLYPNLPQSQILDVLEVGPLSLAVLLVSPLFPAGGRL